MKAISRRSTLELVGVSLAALMGNASRLDAGILIFSPRVYSLAFSGSNAVTLGSGANTALAWDRTQPWSCLAGINVPSSPGTGGAIGGLIFTNSGNSPFNGYEFWIGNGTATGVGNTNNGCLVVRIINNYTNNQILVCGSINVCDGYWHMAGCSYDGSSSAAGVKMYVDGIQDTNLTVLANNLTGSIVGATNPFYLGYQYNSPGYSLGGNMCFFNLSNAVRNASWFGAYPWAANEPAVDSSTVLQFDFTEDAGSTLHDLSSNAYNGTIAGAAWAAGPPSSAPMPSNSVAPAISGTAQQGQTLTASKGTWANAVQFAYQWYWADTLAPISGATGSTYILQSTDVGHTILVKVTGTGAGGSSTVASASTATVTASSNIPTLQSSYHAQTLSGSSLSVSGVSTTGNNCMIYVSCITNSGTAPAISDTAGLTWIARVTNHPSGGYHYSWYAIAASPVTNDTITVSGSAGVVYNNTVMVWAKTGGVAPSLPQAPVVVNGSSTLVQVSTTQPSGVLFGDYWFATTANPTNGSGFTQITTNTYELAEYETFSSAFSNVNVTIGTGAGTTNCGYGELIA